jgi:hypothetical protein
MTQVGLDGEDPDDNDYGDPFRPQQSDGYDDRGSVEPIQPLQSHLQAPSLDAITLASIQTLREVRIMTTQWVLNLGPLDDWPFVFQQHYDIARRSDTDSSTQEEVDAFLGSVQRHIDLGRSILKKLRESPVISPPPSHEAWGDFLTAGDLLETLYHGIAILEVRLDIFAPRGPLSSPGESSIRKWKGLIDNF